MHKRAGVKNDIILLKNDVDTVKIMLEEHQLWEIERESLQTVQLKRDNVVIRLDRADYKRYFKEE